MEIDETVFVKRKYNPGKRVKKNVWILGFYERQTKRCLFIPMKNRKRASIEPLVKR